MMRDILYGHLPVVAVGILAIALIAALMVAEEESPPPVSHAEPAPKVRASDSPAADELIGVVVPESSVDVAAPVEGVVSAVYVRAGAVVKEGEAVARLDDSQIQIEIRRGEAALAVLQTEQRRSVVKSAEVAERLDRRQSAPDLVSREELRALETEQRLVQADTDAAVGRVHQQQAEIDALKSQQLQFQIRAPFSGRVATRHVDPGAWIARGRPIVTLISGSTWVRFAIPRAAYGAFHEGQSVHVLDGVSAPRLARVRALAPDVDGGAELAFIEAELLGDVTAVPGTQVRVRLPQ